MALALLLLADGDPNELALMAANFGRDADTIGTMACSVAGALAGNLAIRPIWAAKVRAASPVDHWANAGHALVMGMTAGSRATRGQRSPFPTSTAS